MARAIEIIDPEGEKREALHRKILVAACFVALALLMYPQFRDYSTKWNALKATRKVAQYLSSLKSQAILEQTAYEASFKSGNSIEVFKVSSCGPGATRTKVSEIPMDDFGTGVVFATSEWVRQNVDTEDPILPRFCYDPMFGSSLLADGLVSGGAFLAHHDDVARSRGDHVIELFIEGTSGALSIE